MCEILAVNTRRAMRVNAALCEFFADSPKHPHGWGLAWRRDDDSVWLDKEPLPAHDSEYLHYLLRAPINTTWLIAHIRNATRGVVTFENCHPFRSTATDGTTWVLAHNGTMLAEDDATYLASFQRGTTDSERVLLRLVALLDDATARSGGSLSFDETFALLADAIARLSHGNKLNLVFGDGTYTFAHTNTVQPTLWRHHGNGRALLCTRPLDDTIGGTWEPMPSRRLIAYRDGEVVAEAAAHGHAFDNDEYLRIIEHEQAHSNVCAPIRT